MSLAKYHPMTFLRSAIARDPFCLGDLGPEDVLRIESYFPELFQPATANFAGHSNNPETLTTNNPLQKQKLSSPKSSSESNSSEEDETPAPVDPVPPTKTNSKIPTFTCSRGSRCGASSKTETNSCIPKRKINVPIMKQPFRPRSSKVIPVPVVPKVSGSRVLPRKSQHSENQADASRTKIRSPYLSGMTKLEMERPPSLPTVKPPSPKNKKPVASSSPGIKLNSVEKQLKTQQHPLNPRLTMPSQGREDLKADILRLVSHSAPNIMSKNPRRANKIPTVESGTNLRRDLRTSLTNIISNYLNPESMMVLHPPPKPFWPSSTKSKDKFPTTASSGFIRPIPSKISSGKINRRSKTHRKSKPEVVEVITTQTQTDLEKLDLNVENVDSTPNEVGKRKGRSKKQQAFSSGSTSEDSTSTSTILSTQTAPAHIQIQKPRLADAISEEITTRDMLQSDSAERVEQLMLAKILASKYEADGKLSKSRTKLKDRQGITANLKQSVSNSFPPSPTVPYPRILETIAEDLIRAEVLKYVHTENTRVDVGVGTASEPLQNGCNFPNNRLTPISEVDSEPLITPLLTPPLEIATKKKNLPPEANLSQSLDDSISTPIITLKKSSADKNNRTRKHQNHNDATDCSSISDFVASDAKDDIRGQRRRLQERRFKDKEESDLKTPPRTPVDVFSPEHSLLSPLLTPPDYSEKLDKFIVRFEEASKRASRTSQDRTPKRDRSASKSKSSFADALSDFERSVNSGFQRIYSEVMSDGELLGTPYKSPGELSLSFSTTSAGLYFSDKDTQDFSLSSENETVTNDNEDTSDCSNGEYYF